jgi:DNA modification methylase
MGKGQRAADQHDGIPREALERGGMTRNNAVPGGTGPNSIYRKRGRGGQDEPRYQRGKAIQTQEWVQGKIAKGDIEGGMSAGQSGTSIFDPVLCELAYRWFCPPGGTVLDPFAGGSVRGVVASVLGRSYVGVDLSARQIAANQAQAARICGEPAPRWIVGDSRGIDSLADGLAADFVFSCPPYADLEIYSDDPADLSTLAYSEFRTAYSEIIAKISTLLKPDRFACFVVGDVRGKDGAYYGFVPDTVAAFQRAGLKFYNEAILVTAAGSLPIRAAKQFEASRKLGKTHQNVLVFCKGDPKKATAAIGPVEFGEFGAEAGDGQFGEPL